MSYDDALDKMRDETTEPPTFAEVKRGYRWRAQRMWPRGRLAVVLGATYLSVLAYLYLSLQPALNAAALGAGRLAAFWQGGVATLLPAALLWWASRLTRREGVGPQMLSRAIWWSNLVVGVLISTAFHGALDRTLGVFIAFACAVALLAAGRRGLDDDRSGDPFAPVRFRGQLLVALVMAFADAQTLAFSALLQLRIGMQGWNLAGTLDYAGPTIVAAAVMALSVWGLYRLRTWALILNLVANIAIAYFALEGALGLSMPVAAALAATAAVQSLLPYPIFAAALGDRDAGKPVLGRLALPSVFALVGLTAVLAVVGRGGGGSGWMTGPGRAFERGLRTTHEVYRMDLRGAQMRGAMITHRVFRECDLREADMESSWPLRSLTFAATDLRGANLSHVAYADVGLYHVDLRGADLTDASLLASHGDEIQAAGASVVRADLQRARLRFSSVAGADFSGANFAFAEIGWPADVAAANFGGATCPDLHVADASGCEGHDGELSRLGVEDRKRYAGKFEALPFEWTMPTNCAAPTGLMRVFADGDFLLLHGVQYFRQTDTTFVRADQHGRLLTAAYDWTRTDGVELVETTPCGEFSWRRVD